MKPGLIVIGLLILIAGYGYTAAQEKVVVVKMEGYHFKPDKITIEPGTTVEWINTDKKAHTVTDDHDSWDSGNLKPGETFSRRYDDQGTFKYYCIPHREAQMTGTIVVKQK